MSFYNLMFGKNPNTEVILALLGLKENDIQRFRDASMNPDGIVIHTRTGGGNREDYPNEILTENPQYLYDEDCDGDETYANYYFKFPEEIKDDCILFCDVQANGVPGSIVRKVIETINRPETNNDKFTRILNEQKRVYSELRYGLQVYETNGHTIVPLSDDTMDRLLAVAEKNDFEGREGEFMVYNIMPYKIHVETEVPKYKNFQPDNLCRVKIDLGGKWEIDVPVWERYKAKFSDKYPIAMDALKKYII